MTRHDNISVLLLAVEVASYQQLVGLLVCVGYYTKCNINFRRTTGREADLLIPCAYRLFPLQRNLRRASSKNGRSGNVAKGNVRAALRIRTVSSGFMAIACCPSTVR